MRFWLLLCLFASLTEARSILRGGLWELQFETGSQRRVDPNWQAVPDSEMSDCDGITDCWEEDDRWTSGRTWVLGAGVYLNDNFRLGLRWQAVTAHGTAPAPFDSSVISVELAWLSSPEGPLAASAALRFGLAPGFPDRDPPNYYPIWGLHLPARVCGAAAGVRWIVSPHVAVDADLVSLELWSTAATDICHFSWLTPRVSVLF